MIPYYGDPIEPKPFYDVAQICMNGHVITEFYKTQPQHGEKFCSTCGEPIISACSHC